MPFSSVATAILVVLIGQTSAITETLREEKQRLNDCIQKIETAPEEAYEDALAWLHEGSRPNAHYCAALSLSALGHHEEAAARLEALAQQKGPATLTERAVFLTQAGNAWLSAGLVDEAIQSFSDALKINRNDPDLFKDRAAAHLAAEQPVQALTDLEEALNIRPVDAEAYKLRALAYLQQDSYDSALESIELSRRYDPENIDTLVLRGEIREAKRIGG